MTLARNLRLHVGDTVRIISPLTGADHVVVRQGSSPRARVIFGSSGSSTLGFDEIRDPSRLVFVDLWQAQRFFEQGDAVTGIEIKVNDLDRAASIGRRIERELGGGPFHTVDWASLNQNLFTALKLQKLALAIVITIIIVVAAFNVVATLVMLVLDKRREVAILKAMGADESKVRQIFLLQGTIIGVVGTGLGLLIGGAACLALMSGQFPLDSQVYFDPQRSGAAEPGGVCVHGDRFADDLRARVDHPCGMGGEAHAHRGPAARVSEEKFLVRNSERRHLDPRTVITAHL